MSSLALSRIGAFSNAASAFLTRSACRVKPLPIVPLEQDHDAHHHNHDAHMALPNAVAPATQLAFGKLLLAGNLKATSVLTRSASVRYAHTDVVVPDFSDYRNSQSANPVQRSSDNYDDRHTYSYISTFGIGLASAYAAKAIVHDIVGIVAPSADVLAMAKIEVKLSDIPEGKNLTVKWRSKPLFVRHRTDAEIADMRAVNTSELRDPQTDEARVQQPQWLVLLGICTHLGCVPLSNAGEYNGYFCPCHGSHYDASGRIRKGPAPLNLEIPPYTIEDDLLVVG